MRAAIAGCALLLLGSAAVQAQTYGGYGGYGDPPPPPPPYDDGYGYGYGHRPPPPPPYDDGYRRGPPPHRYGEDFDGPPPPPPPRRRHCRIVEDFDGAHRVCRPDF